jgi:hypothetical protein
VGGSEAPGFVLAGYTISKGPGSHSLWLIRTDASGAMLWDRVWGGAGSEVGYAIAVLPAIGAAPAGFAVVGHSTPGATADLWLVVADAAGNLVFERTFGGSADDRGTGTALLPGGDLLVSGYTASKGAGNYDAWLLRLDPWGHASCTEAGPCADKAASECDDALPCTLDLCEATKGCVHKPLLDGTACGAGKVCTAGVCK